MKAGSAKLKALLATGKFYMADLYTITLQSGLIIRWTNFDIPLTYAGNVYTPFALDRKGTTESCGLSVDDLDVMVHLNADDKLNGQSILYMMHVGEFDNAVCTLDVAFMPLSNPTDLSAGVVRKFLGNVDFDELDGVGASMKVHHFTQKLNMTIPRNLYMPTCKNTMYDRMCGLNKEKFKQSGTILAGSTQGSLITDLPIGVDVVDVAPSSTVDNKGCGVHGTASLQDSLFDRDRNTYPYANGAHDDKSTPDPVPVGDGSNPMSLHPKCYIWGTGKDARYVVDNAGITLSWGETKLVTRIEVDFEFTEHVWQVGDHIVGFPIHIRDHTGALVADLGWSEAPATLFYDFHTPITVKSLNISAHWDKGYSGVRVFAIVSNPPKFDLGTITFTSGANAGLSRTIRSASGGVLNLAQSFPYPINVGDTFNAYAGCAKTKDMCTQVFYNQARFRGYPFVPTSEVLL